MLLGMTNAKQHMTCFKPYLPWQFSTKLRNTKPKSAKHKESTNSIFLNTSSMELSVNV